MDDEIIQAYARLNVHEFVLEVMMANWVASMTEEDADAFLKDMSGRWKSSWVAGEPAVDDQTAFQILKDASELAEHFANKVRLRASEIRAAQVPGEGNQ